MQGNMLDKLEVDNVLSRSDTDVLYPYKNYLKLKPLCPLQHL